MSDEIISGKQLEFLRKAVEIETTDAKAAGMVGYQARLWAQVSLPYRDPGAISKWVRTNGSLRLVVRPGEITQKDGSIHDGYPYGVVPRLLLTWMATEAVRLQDRELSLGPSLSSFMRTIGFERTGGARIQRLQEQVQRLAKCSMMWKIPARTCLAANISRLLIRGSCGGHLGMVTTRCCGHQRSPCRRSTTSPLSRHRSPWICERWGPCEPMAAAASSWICTPGLPTE